jgi:hypothetical protein
MLLPHSTSNNSICDGTYFLSDIIIGWVLIVGTFVCYVPQIVIFYVLRSNDGFDLTMAMIGGLSNVASTFNAMDVYWNEFYCCRQVSFWRCTVLLLAFFQVLLNYILWHIIYISALMIWPKRKRLIEKKSQILEKRISWIVFALYMILTIAGLYVTVYWNFYFPRHSEIYLIVDDFWGITAALTTGVNCIPQVCFSCFFSQ